MAGDCRLRATAARQPARPLASPVGQMARYHGWATSRREPGRSQTPNQCFGGRCELRRAGTEHPPLLAQRRGQLAFFITGGGWWWWSINESSGLLKSWYFACSTIYFNYLVIKRDFTVDYAFRA